MADIPRVIDPNKLLLLGAVTDWLAVYRRHLERVRTPKELAASRKLSTTRMVQLRWLLTPAIGYPTEPFKVWRRPALPVQGEIAVETTSVDILGLRVLVLKRPQVFVRVGLQATGPATIFAFAGGPYSSALVDSRSLVAGFQSVQMSGATIQSLVIIGPATLQSITGSM